MSGAGVFDLFGLTQVRFETLLLVLVRVLMILANVPIFSATQIPISVRLGLGFILTFVIAQTVPTMPAALTLGPFIVAILVQTMIGYTFGFVANLVFTGIQFAGAILDVQVGFSAVSVVNPLTQQQVTILSEFEIALASILYLVTDSHHALIAGIAGSFSLVPLPFANPDGMLQSSIVTFFTQALFCVFRIAAPVAIVLFLTNITLALMSRVAPQMNVFTVGLPLQLIVGLSMMIITMPLLGAVLPGIFDETPRQLDIVLRHLQTATVP